MTETFEFIPNSFLIHSFNYSIPPALSAMATVLHLLQQGMFIPRPPLTEENLPDQTGKVHIVTGGYSGLAMN